MNDDRKNVAGLIHFEINNYNVNNQNRSYLFFSYDEGNDCPDEPKLLLWDVAKIHLWSRGDEQN